MTIQPSASVLLVLLATCTIMLRCEAAHDEGYLRHHNRAPTPVFPASRARGSIPRRSRSARLRLSLKRTRAREDALVMALARR